MKALPAIMAVLALNILGASGQTASDKAVEEGQTLAAELRSLAPGADSLMTGRLFIERDRKTEVSIPIEIRLVKETEGWQSIYQTLETNRSPGTVLVINQSPGKENSYILSGGTNQKPAEIKHNAPSVPFAGSDFTTTDLGLEFFRWPQQRVIKKEMSRHQFCLVLESKNPDPKPGTYSKVISWIDKDTLGIVQAEAYDHSGKYLKHFLPTSVEKVNGEWQVREVEMRNRVTRLKSRIEFDLKKD